jgi:hypothetical protein
MALSIEAGERVFGADFGFRIGFVFRAATGCARGFIVAPA